MSDGKASGKKPVFPFAAVKLRETSISPKRRRAPRPPGSPATLVKKGIG